METQCLSPGISVAQKERSFKQEAKHYLQDNVLEGKFASEGFCRSLIDCSSLQVQSEKQKSPGSLSGCV